MHLANDGHKELERLSEHIPEPEDESNSSSLDSGVQETLEGIPENSTVSKKPVVKQATL